MILDHGGGMQMEWTPEQAERILQLRRRAAARRVLANAEPTRTGPLRKTSRYVSTRGDARMAELLNEVFDEPI